MNDEFPLVTIITPSYNRASFLKETIESVLSQDYPNIEYIVLDDGSTDNSREVLEMYSGRLIWESHPNMGEQCTVNKGYQMAKGEFIAIVNSDDPLRPGAIKMAVSFLMEDPEALVAYSDYDVIDSDSKIIRTERIPHYDLYKLLVDFNIAMGPGSFIRREALDLIGGRDPKYRYAGDIDFWIRLSFFGRFIHIPQVLATHRVHADAASLTGRSARLAQELVWAIDKAIEDPKLPADLWAMRFRIYAFVHRSAALWCGRDNYAKYKHEILSAYYSTRSYSKLPFRERLSCIISDLVKLDMFSMVSSTKRLFSRIGNILLKIIYLVYPIKSGLYYLVVNLPTLFSRKKSTTNQKAFALVSSYLPPKWSGGAVIIERLLNGLDPNLYCLISQYSDSEVSSEYIERLPAKYHVIPDIQWFPSPLVSSFLGKTIEYLSMHLFAMRRAWFISRILQQEGCSIIVGTTGDLVGVLADFYASRLTRADLYLYYFDDYVTQWWADGKWVELAQKAENFILRFVKGFIVPNDYMKDELIKRHRIPSDIVHIVHNPHPRFDMSDEEIPAISRTDEIRLLFTGAIYHLNFDVFRNLIQAIQNFNDPRLKLHLYTAQPIEILEKEGFGGECVAFHSHVPPAEVFEAQKRADILLIPFTFQPDALGLVRTSATAKLADYLMTGKPVLAIIPPDSYVDWYLNKYECGLTVNSDDPTQITAAISRIVQDQDLCQRLGRNALARAKIDFNPLEAQEDFLKAIGVYLS